MKKKERVWEDKYGANIMYSSVKWKNETILRMGGGRIKENDGGGEFNFCNFCKCHSVLPVQ
jgi:hypothetical protein